MCAFKWLFTPVHAAHPCCLLHKLSAASSTAKTAQKIHELRPVAYCATMASSSSTCKGSRMVWPTGNHSQQRQTPLAHRMRTAQFSQLGYCTGSCTPLLACLVIYGARRASALLIQQGSLQAGRCEMRVLSMACLGSSVVLGARQLNHMPTIVSSSSCDGSTLSPAESVSPCRNKPSKAQWRFTKS